MYWPFNVHHMKQPLNLKHRLCQLVPLHDAELQVTMTLVVKEPDLNGQLVKLSSLPLSFKKKNAIPSCCHVRLFFSPELVLLASEKKKLFKICTRRRGNEHYLFHVQQQESHQDVDDLASLTSSMVGAKVLMFKACMGHWLPKWSQPWRRECHWQLS